MAVSGPTARDGTAVDGQGRALDASLRLRTVRRETSQQQGEGRVRDASHGFLLWWFIPSTARRRAGRRPR